MNGKGSSPRPMPNPEKFRDNFDLIFRKKENTGQEKKDEKPHDHQTSSPHRASD